MSMNCPSCHAKAAVIDTRWSGGGTRRRYKCLGKCKGRWTTTETIMVPIGKEARGRNSVQKMYEEKIRGQVKAEFRRDLKDFLGFVK